MTIGDVTKIPGLSNVCVSCRLKAGRSLTAEGSRTCITNRQMWKWNPVAVAERQCNRCHIRKRWWEYVK